MSNIWFSSDFHFCHNKEFLYKPRGFDNVENMNHAIVENWNSLVKPNDVAYILGDIMLNDNENGLYLFEQLNGSKYIILGNHDTNARIGLYKYCDNVVDILYATILKFGKYNFYLSHYPTKVGNYDDEELHKKFYSLCGHTHTSDKWLDFKECKSYHVELDAHENKPILIDQIIEDIKNYG